MQKRYDVVIIGGGFSGVMLACQLCRCCSGNLSIAVLERSGKPGRGVAFKSQHPRHLLNVPAGRMSAFPDQPEHFVAWLGQHMPAIAGAGEFVPRSLFGAYVGEQFDRTLAETKHDLQWMNDEAISIRAPESHLHTVELRSGSRLQTRYVVLSTGNFPPTDPAPFGKNGKHTYVKYAWSDNALRDLPNSESASILLLGSGLTAVDQILALHATEFRGHIYMLSRRGLMPCTHRLGDRWPTDWTQNLPNTALGLVRAARNEIRNAIAEGCDWRPVIDSLRSCTQKIWLTLPARERARFLRHVRPHWEVHRHRYAPQVQSVVDDLQSANRLTVLAGRVLECRYDSQCAEVLYQNRNSRQESILRVDRIVNCTGPEANFRRMNDPLTQSLMSQKLARSDGLSLGLDVTGDGALIDANGTPSQSLFAIGPLRKGCLWETTAVPEIREQARDLALYLAEQL